MDTVLASDLSDADISRVPHTEIRVSSDREPLRFVKSSHARGILPRILDELLQERKRVKMQMAKENDEFRRSLLNAKQLALKM